MRLLSAVRAQVPEGPARILAVNQLLSSVGLGASVADRANRLGIRRSVGRTGVCFDVEHAETFNSALKNERVNRTQYPTREHARKDVTRHIEVRYNTVRRHPALGHRTPREAYNDHVHLPAAARRHVKPVCEKRRVPHHTLYSATRPQARTRKCAGRRICNLRSRLGHWRGRPRS
jgi:putative transposase